ncbi:YihY/virulence factor BrkB family protein [Neorhizobium galegae]|uniref:YihY/virulence factor BrkB family protein n=1 Tax=Neorhizobium galegae TaxID=399 RepID=UPI000621A1D5|nr:YihY/virulence factor BrkB family protein [Neorhizobium galegae]CDZ29539.1 Ribonuclease BN [Neorhizobium galegae bv. officinalis]KAA9386289.1 YihY/virulence factor BrkB family protein [Neorhizobium galegae]KAB1112855.1 YihY/virulence factor BrkB family protein [Neorhizobium galegae]MCM2500694.1 YihY/virulence factor BrkB family protein [Neorhizobium galegae]MCQ1770653.1 YihY/virulence factor BrkB family protein [Neorhizobium galegae]
MTIGETVPASEKNRGREADSPDEIPARGLKDVFWRVYAGVTQDRISLIAAGVTYYLLLALFPAASALVSLYGFVSDPVSIVDRIAFLSSVMPADALNIFLDQLRALTTERNTTLSIALIGGLALALWSANNGMKALFEAMNVAYGEQEKRSIVRLNLISLLFTLGALLLAIVILFAMGVVPAVLRYLWLDRWTEIIIRFARWPVMMLFVTGGIMMLYRFGPSREPAKLKWLTWGAAFSTVAWLSASIAVSFYLGNIADYNATYGTLGALIGFMVWTWISVIIVIVGAEINAELEHQTARDSTTGRPKPLGARGAYMADTVGERSD